MKRFLNIRITAIAIPLLVTMGAIIFLTLTTQKNILNSEQNRQQALMLAEELFQSSEDLTRMARTYVITGNSIYEQYYFDILDIRNGKQPRPEKYFGTYWHLAGIHKAPSIALGEAVPLQTLMRNVGITEQEFALLKESQSNSDELVNLEKEAFAAVKGFYKDEHGTFTVRRAPDSEYATGLLFGEKYIDSKAKIMEPISRFIEAIGERTNTKLTSLQNRLHGQIEALLVIVVISLSGIVFINKRAIFKVIQPLENQAHFDQMTGMLNRSYFLERANQEIVRSTRYGRPLSLLMIDIDFFKKINDTYGHEKGDQALQKLSRIFREVTREIDVLCRYGGDEFLIMLPETGKESALEVAERLRATVEKSTTQQKEHSFLNFTISIGATTITKPPYIIGDMINHADSALYAAKEFGRNRVCFDW